MSEPENFLSRWSRRKLETERETDSPARPRESGDPEQHGKIEPHNDAPEPVVLDSRLRGNERGAGSDENKEPAFDISKLPSLDSITAETDVSVFLQKGVPAELSRAALRRAWVADPSIRDFIEVAENQWDFVTASDLPGFGPLELSKDEIRRMLADAFGEPRVPATPEAGAAGKTEIAAETSLSEPENLPGPSVRQETIAAVEDQQLPDAPPTGSAEDVVQRNEVDIAMQHSNREPEYKQPPTRRPHGRALPQ